LTRFYIKFLPNSDRKTVKFRIVKKKFAAPFEFLTAPLSLSAAAHSLKTTELFGEVFLMVEKGSMKLS
jgi:hypothetical protein